MILLHVYIFTLFFTSLWCVCSGAWKRISFQEMICTGWVMLYGSVHLILFQQPFPLFPSDATVIGTRICQSLTLLNKIVCMEIRSTDRNVNLEMGFFHIFFAIYFSWPFQRTHLHAWFSWTLHIRTNNVVG